MRVLMLTALLAGAPLAASTPAKYAKLDARSIRACATASGFKDAKLGKPVRFSDTLLVDARVVSGIYPQRHMKGALGTMLCLYNRKTRSVEVQEIALPVAVADTK